MCPVLQLFWRAAPGEELPTYYVAVRWALLMAFWLSQEKEVSSRILAFWTEFLLNRKAEFSFLLEQVRQTVPGLRSERTEWSWPLIPAGYPGQGEAMGPVLRASLLEALDVVQREELGVHYRKMLRDQGYTMYQQITATTKLLNARTSRQMHDVKVLLFGEVPGSGWSRNPKYAALDGFSNQQEKKAPISKLKPESKAADFMKLGEVPDWVRWKDKATSKNVVQGFKSIFGETTKVLQSCVSWNGNDATMPVTCWTNIGELFCWVGAA